MTGMKTCSGSSDYVIMNEDNESITLNGIVWFKVNKEICQ